MKGSVVLKPIKQLRVGFQDEVMIKASIEIPYKMELLNTTKPIGTHLGSPSAMGESSRREEPNLALA